jgi:CMP-N,N'-diacetyllegionaminic acid synthase
LASIRIILKLRKILNTLNFKVKVLIIIPARAGSKGLPGKNTKLLGDKPLISYTIEYALKIKNADDAICVTTNDDDVIEIARSYHLDVPFKRPEELASDHSSSNDVIMHALNYYESQKQFFDAVLLLQPTSPFRIQDDFDRLKEQFTDDCEMAVSVKNIKENPYFSIFEESPEGYLEKSKKGNFSTRQECPPVFAYNGSMYLIRLSSLKKTHLHGFKNIKKMIMPAERSIDIDTIEDWIMAEYILTS